VEELHIGLDDFDSYNGGCTTHLAAFLCYALLKFRNAKLLDLPHLVRLNPSIPWKTRGNGAVAIHLQVPKDNVEDVVELVLRFVHKYAKIFAGPDQEPGVVIIRGSLPKYLRDLYRLAVSDYVVEDYVKQLLRRDNAIVDGGRGVVGATAALSWWLYRGDYTYELLTYRTADKKSPYRCIDAKSVIEYDREYGAYTFNNVEYLPRNRVRILISPHGPDPVLYGVRGDDLNAVLKALDKITVCETIDAWAVFRTNQGTDDHAVPRKADDVKPYRTASLLLTIASEPQRLPGGHVSLVGCDDSGCIRLVFFKKTGLTKIASQLTKGDIVKVLGSAKLWSDGRLSFHVEKIEIVKLQDLEITLVPTCPRCGGSMESLGKDKGYRCRKCGYRVKFLTKKRSFNPRMIAAGVYVPPPSAMKHLLKPLKRIGLEKRLWRPLEILPDTPYIHVRDVRNLLKILVN